MKKRPNSNRLPAEFFNARPPITMSELWWHDFDMIHPQAFAFNPYTAILCSTVVNAFIASCPGVCPPRTGKMLGLILEMLGWIFGFVWIAAWLSFVVATIAVLVVLFFT